MTNGFAIANKFKSTATAVVHEGDCRDMLRDIPDGVIQLVVTSPPYNLGKEYENRLRVDEYIEEQRPFRTRWEHPLNGRRANCNREDYKQKVDQSESHSLPSGNSI